MEMLMPTMLMNSREQKTDAILDMTPEMSAEGSCDSQAQDCNGQDNGETEHRHAFAYVVEHQSHDESQHGQRH
jgi:hypothetical protein